MVYTLIWPQSFASDWDQQVLFNSYKRNGCNHCHDAFELKKYVHEHVNTVSLNKHESRFLQKY
jgi:hypothetical protein